MLVTVIIIPIVTVLYLISYITYKYIHLHQPYLYPQDSGSLMALEFLSFVQHMLSSPHTKDYQEIVLAVDHRRLTFFTI